MLTGRLGTRRGPAPRDIVCRGGTAVVGRMIGGVDRILKKGQRYVRNTQPRMAVPWGGSRQYGLLILAGLGAAGFHSMMGVVGVVVDLADL